MVEKRAVCFERDGCIRCERSRTASQKSKSGSLSEAARKRRVWWEPFREVDARRRSAQQNAREVEIHGREYNSFLGIASLLLY
jgi:histone acetyltransferase (RNA polymerase elongator complex component)